MVEMGEAGGLDPLQFIWVDWSAVCPQPQQRCPRAQESGSRVRGPTFEGRLEHSHAHDTPSCQIAGSVGPWRTPIPRGTLIRTKRRLWCTSMWTVDGGLLVLLCDVLNVLENHHG